MGLSKLMATIICYPFIFIKNNQQSSQQQAVPKTIGDVVTSTYDEYGFCGFYKGFCTKLVQTTLNNALMFAIKEKVYVFVQSKLHHIGFIYLYASILLLVFAIFRCFRNGMNANENDKLSKELEEELLDNQSTASVYVQTS